MRKSCRADCDTPMGSVELRPANAVGIRAEADLLERDWRETGFPGGGLWGESGNRPQPPESRSCAFRRCEAGGDEGNQLREPFAVGLSKHCIRLVKNDLKCSNPFACDSGHVPSGHTQASRCFLTASF